MARKCKKNDKNPPLRCVLKGFGHLGADVGKGVAKGVSMRAKSIHALPSKKHTIANSLVGNVKAGHGGLCHMNKIEKMEGSRSGGKGLKRVVSKK